MEITYTKKAESYDGYGRGIDNYHAPAQWWVVASTSSGTSKKVGFIYSDHVHYFETPTYKFGFVMEGKPNEITVLGGSSLPTTSRLRDMKEKINDVERWIGRWFECASGQIKRDQAKLDEMGVS